MRILIATIFAYPPKGGLGSYIKELKTGLERSGHEVDILARHRDEYFLTRGTERIRLHRQTSGKTALPPGLTGSTILKYSQAMRTEANRFLGAVRALDLKRYQIIHPQDIVSNSILRFHGPRTTPVIMTVHGCVTAEYYYFGYIKPQSVGWKVVSAYESSVLRRSDRVIVPSNWLLSVYRKCGIPTGNMQIIPNGIDIAGFERQMNKPTDLRKPAGKTVILCTGRVEKVKGQHILLDALARLKKKRTDWVCWIAGRGAMEDALKKQAARLGLGDSVKFLGRRTDIPALLKQADIFVIPSLEENFPYSLVEAQAAGKAIVASQAGGMTEMMKHGENGLLVPTGDKRALSRSLEKLLNQPNLQKKLAGNASVWAREHFSLDMMTKRVLAVYDSALKARSSDRSGT